MTTAAIRPLALMMTPAQTALPGSGRGPATRIRSTSMQKPRKFPRSQSHRLSWSLAGAIVALALPGMAAGQVVDTNRPGFSFTPGVVADGRWQLETGIAYERPDSGSHSISLPQAEARFGLSDGVELFVSSDPRGAFLTTPRAARPRTLPFAAAWSRRAIRRTPRRCYPAYFSACSSPA